MSTHTLRIITITFKHDDSTPVDQPETWLYVLSQDQSKNKVDGIEGSKYLLSETLDFGKYEENMYAEVAKTQIKYRFRLRFEFLF